MVEGKSLWWMGWDVFGGGSGDEDGSTDASSALF